MKKLQHHEKKFISRLEELSSTKIADNDAKMLIQVVRRHSKHPDAYRALSAADMSDQKDLFNTQTSFLFIQNGLFHKSFSSVDTSIPYIVIQTRSGRETTQGCPVYEIWCENT